MPTSEKQLLESGVLYTDRRRFYLDENDVKELWPTVTPFITMISNRGVRSVTDPVFKQFEHRSNFIKQQFVPGDVVTIAGAGTESNAVTPGTIVGLPAVDNSWLGLEVEFWDSTLTTRKGVALITAITGSDVKFKNLGTVDFDTATNDVARVIGRGDGEGAESPEANSDELSVVWGSTQTFRTPVQITGHLLHAALRGYSKELERLRVEKSKEHQYMVEQALLFGKSIIGTGLDGTGSFGDTGRDDKDGNKVRTTYGLVSAIEDFGVSTPTADNQNIFTVNSGSYTYSQFVDDMEKIFQYLPTSGSKTAFCGAKALSYWSKLDASTGFAGLSGWKVQLGPSTPSSLGYNVRQLTTPHGNLNLVWAPALRGPRAGYMVITSDENLSLVQYRAPMYRTNIRTDNAPDLVKDEYFSEYGVALSLIETHSLMKVIQ